MRSNREVFGTNRPESQIRVKRFGGQGRYKSGSQGGGTDRKKLDYQKPASLVSCDSDIQ